MSTMGEWGRRVWFLLNRRRHEEALRREMESHRAMMADPRRFGNTLRIREESREVWGWLWVDDLGRDLRYALKTLARAPGFTVVAILSLACATGATTAIFSVVNGVVLRPLPFADADRLVQVFGRAWREERGPMVDPVNGPLAAPELEALQQSALFESVAAYSVATAHLTGSSGTQRLTAVAADLSLFSVLQVDAIAGRPFRPDDGVDVAVISASLWQRWFAADPAISGRVVTLNDRPFTIVGVMPNSFQFPYSAGSILPGALPESRTDVWIPQPPLRQADGSPNRRGRLSVVARLEPATTIAAASAELKAIAARLQQQQPAGSRVRFDMRAERLDDVVVGEVRRSLWFLFAAVGLVLAAACANVANLLLARMTTRVREVVTRAALGASRQRLMRQFLAESLLLALAGGVAGALVARWATGIVTTLAAPMIPRAHEVALDWQAFLFLFLICAATAVLFGLGPALAVTRMDLQSATRESSGHATMARRFGRLRDGLVVIEVALAFVLAAGAATVVAELMRLHRVDNGMNIEGVLTLHLTPSVPAAHYAEIEQRVAALPGVTSAGLTQLVPLQNWGWTGDFSVPGRDHATRSIAGLRYVTPGYFKTLGIPILRGRAFTAQDNAGAPPVILVNDTLARRYFPGQNPVGVALDRGAIVGVVGDVRQIGLDQPAEPEIYYPTAQNVATASDIGMALMVRVAGAPDRTVDAIRAAVHEVSPTLAVFNVRTMTQVVSDSLLELRLYRWLMGLFSAVALLLTAIGLHGVIAYNIASRIREFAVRLALGADPGLLIRIVLRRAVQLVAVGLIAGAPAAAASGRFIESLPGGLAPGPTVYAAVSATLITVALLAALFPALRVVRVNPATALRHE